MKDLSGHPIVLKVKHVKAGDHATKAIGFTAFVDSSVPADGFIVQYGTSSTNLFPVFIREEDLEKAKALREEKGKAVAVDAESWGD